MEEYKGYVDPELAKFLYYDGPDFSAFIGDDYVSDIVELNPNEEGVYE